MKTRNHDPEPTQTDSGLYSEAEPPADEGPQRSTDAGGPYTDEELREAREHMARCADREFISVVEFRRLLATLDERTRERDEARRPPPRKDEMASNDVCGLCGAPGTALDHGTLGCAKRLRAEAASLRERLSAAEREKDGWKSDFLDVAGAYAAAEREVASLRAEVARLRDSERKAWESCRETCVNLAAAERRAEEAEGRLQAVRLRLNAALQPAHMINGQPDGRSKDDVIDDVMALARDLDDTDPTKWQPGDVIARDGHEWVRWRLIERSSAPGWRVIDDEGYRSFFRDSDVREKGYRRIRSRVMELEGRLRTQSEGEPTVTVTIEEDDASSAAVRLGAARLHLEERARNTASDVCRYVFEAEAEALERVEMALEVAVAASRAARASTEERRG